MKPAIPFLLQILLTLTCWAQEEVAVRQAPPRIPVGSTVALPPVPPRDDSLERFVDGLMADQFHSRRLAGAVVAVVKGDQVILLKGYGFSDLEAGTRVDPSTTLFRVASISKLFTWTAAMQLAERGRLNLDQDVNSYLVRLEIPAKYDQPVTMSQLMTHTAGFEDRLIGLLPRSNGFTASLEKLLSDRLPQRVRPPGQVPAYSNYGSALAALVVQDVSGVSWESFVKHNILIPLGMSRTHLARPEEWFPSSEMAKGYAFRDGKLERMSYQHVAGVPAGGIASTAEDLARFMTAHLQNGAYQGRRILREETAIRMQSLSFSTGPAGGGLAHGFLVYSRNGKRLIGHGGDISEFHSGLWLLPEEKLGFFVAYNAEEGAEARNSFQAALVDYWFPALPGKVEALSGFSERASQISGEYLPSRRPYTTLDRFIEIVGHLKLEPVAEGVLRSWTPGDHVQRWVEVEPYLFREIDGQSTLVVRMDSGGPVVSFGERPIVAFEKAAWFETLSFHLTLALAALLVFLSTLTFPVLRWLVVRRADRMLGRQDPNHPRARFLAGLVSALNLVFVVALIWTLADPLILIEGIPPALPYVLGLPLLSGFLSVVTLIVAIFAWRGSYWSFPARLHYTTVGIMAVAFLWQLNYWNLLGFKF